MRSYVIEKFLEWYRKMTLHYKRSLTLVIVLITLVYLCISFFSVYLVKFVYATINWWNKDVYIQRLHMTTHYHHIYRHANQETVSLLHRENCLLNKIRLLCYVIVWQCLVCTWQWEITWDARHPITPLKFKYFQYVYYSINWSF